MMKKNYSTIRIIIADDHEIFRDGFQVMLRKEADIELVAEAGNGKELISLIKLHDPDVIITDIKMPVLDGIEATKIIQKEFPNVGIIALSMFEEENLIVDMLEAGAKGYLLKNAHKQEIISAIKTVYRGNAYYCMQTSTRLTHLIAKSRFNPNKKENKPEFSAREIAIIKLICKQLCNKEMASELGLSVRTIEGYREKIQEKIDAKNSAGIVVYAIKNQIFNC